MENNLKRVEALIADTEKDMGKARYTNTKWDLQDILYEAKALRAKILGDIDEAIRLHKEHLEVLSKRFA